MFKDLFFKRHSALCLDTHAVYYYPNGYGISATTGEGAHQNDGTYEVAILHNGEICYATPITDDILGYQTPDDIDAIMTKISQYEKDQYIDADENVKKWLSEICEDNNDIDVFV